MSVIARPTTRSRAEVSQSFFSFLFAEVVASAHHNTEEHLHKIGRDAGARIFPLFHLRDRPFRRELKPFACLQFIGTNVWRSLFGHHAEVMATDQAGEFHLVDRKLLLNKFISVSETEALDNSTVNCAYYAAGLIEGMLSSDFKNAKVDAVFTHAGSLEVVGDPANVTFVVRLESSLS